MPPDTGPRIDSPAQKGVKSFFIHFFRPEEFMSQFKDARLCSGSRRTFLKSSGLMTAVAVGSVTLPKLAGAAEAKPAETPSRQAMPTRNLGKTGYKVGIFSLGGQAALEKPHNEDLAVPVIEKALDLGVNYIDTSSIYGGPERWSEQYVGQVMKRRRSETFLATKTKERTREGSKRMIDKSLALLETDHIDLWQLHDIGTMTDINQIFAKGGAMEALLEAQDQKIVKYLGITGHYRPDALIEAIHRHPFDTILMALNAADPHHYSFSAELLPLAVEKHMGIVGMKVPARGRILSTWTPPPIEQQKHMWEGMVLAPTPGALHMREAMYYSLSLPVSTVIIGCDSIAQLEQNVQLARDFTPLSRQEMTQLTERAEPVSKQSLFFRFYDRA
jgi:uncharacterized protein